VKIMSKRFLRVSLVAVLVVTAMTCAFLRSAASATKRIAAQPQNPAPQVVKVPAAGGLKTFSSYDQLADYLRQQAALTNRLGFCYAPHLRVSGAVAEKMAAPQAASPQPLSDSGAAKESSLDYSSTNVQVEGVDEADVVKTDGKYLYVISEGKVAIVKAYPPKEARVLAEINFPGRPGEVLVAGDNLVIFGADTRTVEFIAEVYDVSNREEPVLRRSIKSAGHYVTSRLIGDYAYVVTSAPVYGNGGLEKPVLPKLRVDGRDRTIPPTRIHYFDVPDEAYQYTVIIAVNIRDKDRDVTEKTLLTGISQNVFVSENNLYLTGAKMPDVVAQSNRLFEKISLLLPPALRQGLTQAPGSAPDPAARFNQVEALVDEYLNGLAAADAENLERKIRTIYQEWQQDTARETAQVRNATVVYKLAVDGGTVTYQCKGEVPGQVLNQFSMDEYQGFFRIATTSEGFVLSGPSLPRNNVYVLDKNLQIAGRLVGLAPGERIYAARFMGDRCYLVTFRRVDPLFTIDLKDPQNPKVLGELKIPGYSDYLHPYDDRYLIGIGKEVVEEPRPVPMAAPMMRIAPEIPPAPPTRETGVKIALFDVQDPTKPREIAKYVIEGQSVDSIALRDHKAVLFSKAKNLLAIPVTEYPSHRMLPDLPEGGKPYYRVLQEAYVFNISPGGIDLKGTVRHQFEDTGGGETCSPVKRCLYIGNVLYTVSDYLVKMNSLSNLEEINQVRL